MDDLTYSLIEPKRRVKRVITASGAPFMLHGLRRTGLPGPVEEP